MLVKHSNTLVYHRSLGWCEENIDLLEEEERRLFYVALTQAQESVYFLSETGNESIFIEEIGEEHLDRYNYYTLPG